MKTQINPQKVETKIIEIEPTFTITLDRREALILAMLIGGDNTNLDLLKVNNGLESYGSPLANIFEVDGVAYGLWRDLKNFSLNKNKV